MSSPNRIKSNKNFISFQEQAVCKLIEKEDQNKSFIKIWRHILKFKNISYKIISDMFAARLKKGPPYLI